MITTINHYDDHDDDYYNKCTGIILLTMVAMATSWRTFSCERRSFFSAGSWMFLSFSFQRLLLLTEALIDVCRLQFHVGTKQEPVCICKHSSGLKRRQDTQNKYQLKQKIVFPEGTMRLWCEKEAARIVWLTRKKKNLQRLFNRHETKETPSLAAAPTKRVCMCMRFKCVRLRVQTMPGKKDDCYTRSN